MKLDEEAGTNLAALRMYRNSKVEQHSNGKAEGS